MPMRCAKLQRHNADVEAFRTLSRADVARRLTGLVSRPAQFQSAQARHFMLHL
jgi:hypothetical protein